MPPLTSRRVALCLVTLLLGVLSAGCGGGDDGGEGGDGASTTQETTQASGGNETLTDEQYTEYTAAAETFADARDIAEGRLLSCPGDNLDEFASCIGTTLDDLETATDELESTLESFAGTVSGECATALGTLGGYANSYSASVAVLQEVIDTGNAAGLPNARSSLQQLTEGGRDAANTFELACTPG